MSPLQFAQVNGLRLAYERAGSGLPILLIHGFPRGRRLWRKIVPLLSHRFDTVAIDRRGYGESDRPADPAAYDNRSMTQDALELVRELGWQRFRVVGHDLGQAVAQRLAAEHAESVVGAVFLDGLPYGVRRQRRDASGRSWYMDFFLQRDVAEQIIGQNPRLFFSLLLDRNSHLMRQEHDEFLEPFCPTGSVPAVLGDYRHRLEDDQRYWEEWLSSGQKIEVPVSVLWGANGPVADKAVLELWQSVARDVHGAEIAGAAHYVQEEQPAEVAHHLLQFADELGI